jgi:hypothetical protein
MHRYPARFAASIFVTAWACAGSVACSHATAPQPVEATEPTGSSFAASSADPLAFLPGDSDVVMGSDVARLRASPLWHELEPKLAARVGPRLARVRAECGFDPMMTAGRIALATKISEDGKRSTVIVAHGIDAARTLACLPSLLGDRVVMDRGVAIVHDARGAAAIAFADPQTAVVLEAPDADHDRVMAVLSGGAPLRRSEAYAQMFRGLDPSASAWIVVGARSRALARLAGQGLSITSIVGTVHVADGMTASLKVRVPNPELALQLEQMGKAQLAALHGFAQRLDLVAQGDTLDVEVSMSSDQVHTVVGMAEAALQNQGFESTGPDEPAAGPVETPAGQAPTGAAD